MIEQKVVGGEIDIVPNLRILNYGFRMKKKA